MAIALVGSPSAIATAAAATVTPAFAQATTAGNLLIARVVAVGTGAISTTSTGWTLANGWTNNPATAIFYRANCGAGETAPTFTSTGATTMFADLTEWSGAATSSPVDQVQNSGNGTAQILLGVFPNTDTAVGDLAIGVVGCTNSKSATCAFVDNWANPPPGTVVTATGRGTGATKATAFFWGTSGYIVSALTGEDQNNVSVTPSTGSLTGETTAAASFKEFVADPTLPTSSDSGTATDSGSISATPTTAEAGTGSNAGTVAATVATSDARTGADTSVLVGISAADSGTVAEGAALALASSDSAVATELGVSYSVNKMPPDAVLAATNIDSTLASVQDDPDAPDGTFDNATIITNADDMRTSFGTPTGTLKVGGLYQEFRIYLRPSGG